jgi:hypothetical protein
MKNAQITMFLNALPLGDNGRLRTLRHLDFVISEKVYNAAKDHIVSLCWPIIIARRVDLNSYGIV